MVMKSLLAEWVDGQLVLPAEALELLQTAAPVRVVTDSERGTVTLFRTDPMRLKTQTEGVMDALAELHQGLKLDQHAPPVEASRKGRRGPDAEADPQ
jgi:hypothetical protein